MTPLNSILSNSNICYKRFLELLIDAPENNLKNNESLQILKAINQSGQIMYFYNQS